MKLSLPILVLPILAWHACQPAQPTGPIVEKGEDFDSYWHQGKAEITSYDLFQARYGEMREGEAVIVFVTEEHDREKQVKLDQPGIDPALKVGVLKMNLTKRFYTGLYPYHMMLSSFVEAGGIAPWQGLKISASCQEWCGQTYAQLNRRNDHYRYRLHSYFEKENETDKHLNRHMTEDAVWNLIRINPNALIQTDSILIIPSLLFARLSHIELKPYRARTSHLSLDLGNKVYHIEYPSLGRSLYIEYEPEFPHQIVRWSEEYKDGFGENAKVLTTTARRKKQIMSDYWNRHGIVDDSLRMELDLMKL